MTAPSLPPLSGTASAIADHLWQSTVFALAIWLLTLFLRTNQARIRHALWLAASFKFLLPFSLLITLGSLLPQPRPTATATPETIYSAVDLATQPFATWQPTPAVHLTPTPTELLAAYLPSTLLALWITGTFVVLLTWCIRWRHLNATLRRATPAPAGRELHLLRRVEAALPPRPPLPLRLSAELIEPGIFGILRPILVWPKRLTERLEDEHIEAILTHELMHVSRRDNLTAALHMLVEAALWFHPLVWWIGRRLLDERERACDEAVVQLGGHPEAYAESLLKACRFCIESPLPCVSGITGADLSHRVRSIMTAAFAAQLGPVRKALLASTALAALSVPIALGVVRFFPVSAQILHATGPLPSFEVATIRPWQPKPLPMVSDGTTIHPQFPLRVDPGTFHQQGQRTDQVQFIGQTILLIATAYNLQVGHENEIIGAPDWAIQQSNRYEVKAKIEPSKYAEMQKMTPEQQRDQVQLMEQSLLAERFKLKVHFETRNLPVYALVVAKGGAKLTRARDGEVGGIRNTREDEHGMETTGTAVTLDQVSHSLILFGGKRVVDQTRLKGKYDFKLTWRSERPQTDDTASTSDAPVLSAALREQLGLQLVPSKAHVEVIVIDHIERPTEVAEANTPLPPPPLPVSSAPRSAEGLPQQAAAGAGQQTAGGKMEFAVPSVLPVQSPAASHQAFDVVTIKPSKTFVGGMGLGKSSKDSVSLINVSPRALIANAYGLKPRLVSGGPDWMDSTEYDIECKVLVTDPSHSPQLTRDQIRLMMQSLLADRFKLSLHTQSRQLPVFALAIAKGGPKLQEAKPGDTYPNGLKGPDGRSGSGMMIVKDQKFTGQAIAISGIVDTLSILLDRTVVDRTGLTGRYDVTLLLPGPERVPSLQGPPTDPPQPALMIHNHPSSLS